MPTNNPRARRPPPLPTRIVHGFGSPGSASVASSLTSRSSPAAADAAPAGTNNVSESSTTAAGDDTTVSSSCNNQELVSEIERLNLEDLEGGDGGDSDVEGEEVDVHKFVSNSEKDFGTEDSVEAQDEGEVKVLLKLMGTGGTQELGELSSDGSRGNNNY